MEGTNMETMAKLATRNHIEWWQERITEIECPKCGSFEVAHDRAHATDTAYCPSCEKPATITADTDRRGWFWWTCSPGCLPDSDMSGPFATEKDVLTDATRDLEDEDGDEFDFAIDTALSWDGSFPAVGKGDYIVTIGSIDTEEVKVLVSRRYTEAVDAAQAAEIALDAFAERHDFDRDDEGKLVAITEEGSTEFPCWVVSTEEVK